MIFKDLEIGVQFRFVGSGIIHTKVGEDKYEEKSGGICSCRDYVECTPEIRNFDTLEIGAVFWFVNNASRCVKVSVDSYYMDGSILQCLSRGQCVKRLMFKDLAVGAKFKFAGEKREFYKTYDTCCATTVKDISVEVEK